MMTDPDSGTVEMPEVDSGPPVVFPEDVLVYAHSKDTLYSFEPSTNSVVEIGKFTLEGGKAENILDLAVDAQGKMFAVGVTTLYSVDPTEATLTVIGFLDFGGADEVQIPALGFIPATVFRSYEALLGADNTGRVFEINRETAKITDLGQYPDGWLSSGDIVSVKGLGTYATVKRDNAVSDTLVRITFNTNGIAAMTVVGPIENESTEFKRLYGLGYWGQSLYGFAADGTLISIDKDTAKAQVVSGDTGTDEFWGAGVTTLAPILQ